MTKPTGHTTPGGGTARTSTWTLLAAFLVGWWSVNVDHLTRNEKALGVVVVAGAINYVVTVIENRYGHGFLRDPAATPHTPKLAVVRLHPDDIAAIGKAAKTPRSPRTRTPRTEAP